MGEARQIHRFGADVMAFECVDRGPTPVVEIDHQRSRTTTMCQRRQRVRARRAHDDGRVRLHLEGGAADGRVAVQLDQQIPKPLGRLDGRHQVRTQPPKPTDLGSTREESPTRREQGGRFLDEGRQRSCGGGDKAHLIGLPGSGDVAELFDRMHARTVATRDDLTRAVRRRRQRGVADLLNRRPGRYLGDP
ncbi:MAG: hypothetical protein R2698_07840 [Microthrixaceae bacterium]